MTFDEAIIEWAGGRVPAGATTLNIEHGMRRGIPGCDTCGFGSEEDEVFIKITYRDEDDCTHYTEVEGETMTSLLRGLFEASSK